MEIARFLLFRLSVYLLSIWVIRRIFCKFVYHFFNAADWIQKWRATALVLPTDRGATMNGLHSAPPDPRMHRAPRHVPFRVSHFVVSSRDCVEFDSSTSVRKFRRVKRSCVVLLDAVARITHERIVTRTSRIRTRFRIISLPPVALFAYFVACTRTCAWELTSERASEQTCKRSCKRSA